MATWVAAGLVAMVAWTSPLLAQQTPESTMQGEHIVRPGETLWDLARRYLQNPFLWGIIYEANRGTVADPHWIYPDDRLRIPGLPSAGAVVEEAPLAEVAAPPARTRFYVPRGEEPSAPDRPGFAEDDDARLALRAEEFHASPWLAERSELAVLGELVSVVGRDMTMRRLPRSVFPHDRVFLRYLGERAPAVDERLLMVREDGSVRRMGRVIRPTAIVRVTRLEEEVFEAVVEEQFDRTLTGDHAVVMESFPGPVGAAVVPVVDGPQGRLVAFFDDPLLPKESSIGFVDLGAAHGIGFGDELVAFLPERRAGGGYNEMLPAEPVARLKVLRVRERSATVKVIDMDLPSLEAGMPVHLVATTP